MSTAAISETPAPATFLLVRPLPSSSTPAPSPTPQENQENIVELFAGTPQTRPSRNTASTADEASAPAEETSTKIGTVGLNAAGVGTVQTLDPESAERAVVGNMSCKVAQSALEILHGVRSVQQLARWLDARCLSALSTRARLYAEAYREQERRSSNDGGYPDNVQMLHRQPHVQSVHCHVVGPGIFETAVVVADRTRFRAIAMRLELSHGLWKVTALRIG
ncbi:Rv3235 family protein [Arthrobacter psychrochitiniphilus]|uniref:Uncharacterized protein n=1 Tax=Arthrobacter psychrochitiniphilus TaxID=291045 RepID=A0A2V3DQT2_9MICC|nr:Rv3235 family protein [Arthrobacter psychrochitiniphilus]NYG18354.1 hypothetical protein [Arthrobacter psychrochitiniphilus]PXA64869.1 hypothetical protein CVS29_11730 [Arthrobacter psychrochitiniphilus]